MKKSIKLAAVLTVIALLCVGCQTNGGAEEKSDARIDLDNVKLVRMDEESEIEIQEGGDNREVVVGSGGVFYNVTKSLKDDETFVIRTSTMMVDIREGCGWVEVFDDTHMNVFILTGAAECSITDSESGESKTEQVSSREKAEMRFYSKKASGTSSITKDKLDVYEIPSYVLEEVLADNGLRRRINDTLSLQIPKDGSPQAYFLRGVAHISDGETEENVELARADYEKALELDEKACDAYLGLADLKIRQGEYGDAMEILADGLQKAEDKVEIKKKIAEIESGEIMDFQGRMRKYIAYEDGHLAWYYDYFYDEQGRRIKILSYDASGKQTGGGDELYDEEGRVLQAYEREIKNGRLMKETYEYDENGNQVRRNVYDPDDVFIYYRVYEYDGKGNLVKSSQYDAADYLDLYYTYEYDKDGNQTRKNHYAEDGTLITYHLYEYDEKGYCIRDKSYRGNGELRWDTTYEYDEEGNQISEQRAMDEE